MRYNAEGGELDPVVDIRRRYKNSSSVLFYIGRTKESCDRRSEVGTVHRGRGNDEPDPLRKPKESGESDNCERFCL